MDELPDDVLGQVMSLLSAKDVLACRLVCKRLADAALHPYVWQDRVLQGDGVDRRFVCPVLRLAPRLHELALTLGRGRSLRPQLVANTCAVEDSRRPQPFAATCAVRRLSLKVTFGGGAEGAARLIREQEALGRLREVCIDIDMSMDRNDGKVLLDTLASTQGLETLSLTSDVYLPIFKLHLRTSFPSSLREFSCWLTENTEPFVGHILALHADTLEKVIFDYSSDYLPSASAMPLLSRMPNLRTLQCTVVPGLQQLAASGSLKELMVIISAGPGLGPANLDPSRASLTTLSWQITEETQQLCESILTQHAATLEEVTLAEEPPLPATARPLCCMPNLRKLRYLRPIDENHFRDEYEDHDFGPYYGILGAGTSSLKYFNCELDSEARPFCNYILAQHADTLEEVEVDLENCSDPPSAATARLLARMPRLRSLGCHLMPGLQELAACGSLRKLWLRAVVTVMPGVDYAPDAAELLRRAEQLTDVGLQYHMLDPNGPADVSEDLILALASSRRSQVETLHVLFDSEDKIFPQLRSLLQALPGLPALRKLELNMASDELLRGITPENAPALRSLKMLPFEEGGAPNYWTMMCAHAILHRDVVRSLLEANPYLHVELYSRPCRDCSVCEWDCHKDLFDGPYVGIFAHPEGVCPYPGEHNDDGQWLHVHDKSLTKQLTYTENTFW